MKQVLAHQCKKTVPPSTQLQKGKLVQRRRGKGATLNP
ncbi:hypothetical protein NSPZN2_60128 [Nitrospira defluvii]|uniref:Uncharacterized protein n=1 Tax=Nitrospira defluvii TaxID=330214 RepID=A0ABN7MBX6_9BACT|nr:hypothetical protein NSPZN2_60128 [Nitrospira defluvii]